MLNKLELLSSEADQLAKFLKIAADNMDNPFEVAEFCDANASTCPALAELSHAINKDHDEVMQHYQEVENERFQIRMDDFFTNQNEE